MSIVQEFAQLLAAHGVPPDDATRLVKGLQFNIDQMTVRDALGRRLTTKQRQEIRTRILRGEPLRLILDALR